MDRLDVFNIVLRNNRTCLSYELGCKRNVGGGATGRLLASFFASSLSRHIARSVAFIGDLFKISPCRVMFEIVAETYDGERNQIAWGINHHYASLLQNYKLRSGLRIILAAMHN